MMLRVSDKCADIALWRQTIIHGLPVLASVAAALHSLSDRSSIQELIDFATVSALHPDSSKRRVAQP
jgi:hypothetical protein